MNKIYILLKAWWTENKIRRRKFNEHKVQRATEITTQRFHLLESQFCRADSQNSTPKHKIIVSSPLIYEVYTQLVHDCKIVGEDK